MPRERLIRSPGARLAACHRFAPFAFDAPDGWSEYPITRAPCGRFADRARVFAADARRDGLAALVLDFLWGER